MITVNRFHIKQFGWIALSAVFIFPQTALAHGGADASQYPWEVWNLTADIVLGTLLLLSFYAVGIWRRRHNRKPTAPWRHVAFFTGVVALFIALQSPVDTLAERSFLIHQIQHFLIRMVGPMLIFLSAPQGTLVAGIPDYLRRSVVKPVLSSTGIRSVFSFIAHPASVTALFIGTFYFWQLPEFHNLAILNIYIHYLMHSILLITGLLFFWRLFDRRPAPKGARFGVRLMMIWIMILSNILIGAYLTFKGQILYPAYDVIGRLWFPALTDEQLGSITIWIPNSMMGLISILIVIHMWGLQETKDNERRLAKLASYGHGWNEPPLTGPEMVRQRAPKNKQIALGLAAFAFSMYATAILIGVASQLLSK